MASKIYDSQSVLSEVYDDVGKRLKVEVGGASVSVSASELEIGKVVIKNDTTSDVATVNGAGQLFVKAADLETLLTAIKSTDGIKKITDALPAGTNLLGKLQISDGSNDVPVDTTGGFNAVPVVTATGQNQLEILPAETVTLNTFSTAADTSTLGYASSRLFIESDGAASVEVFYAPTNAEFPDTAYETVVFAGAGKLLSAQDVPLWGKFVKVRPSATVDITLDVFRGR